MRLQLTAAGATLAALAALASNAAADQNPTRVGLDTLVYTDTDNVLVVTPQVNAHAALDEDGGEVSARTAVDVISAASVDVVSEATHRFHETRVEAELGISKEVYGLLPSLGYRVSLEPDYHSHTFSLGLQRDLGSSDTTLSLSYSLSLDTVGRHGTSFDDFSESLTTHAASLSLTQVLGPETLVRAVYSLTAQNGYMEKPYRHVPLFDQAGIMAAAADGVTLDLDTFGDYSLSMRPPEEVPDSRLRQAVAVRGLRYLPSLSGSLRLDYRFYFDDWGITSHTVETALRFPWMSGRQLTFFLRYYRQSGASFWRRQYVVAGDGTIPDLRTVDRELSPFQSFYGGARLEWNQAPYTIYADLTGMLNLYSDYMFLDRRFALVSQLGIKLDL